MAFVSIKQLQQFLSRNSFLWVTLEAAGHYGPGERVEVLGDIGEFFGCSDEVGEVPRIHVLLRPWRSPSRKLQQGASETPNIGFAGIDRICNAFRGHPKDSSFEGFASLFLVIPHGHCSFEIFRTSEISELQDSFTC